MYHPFHPNVVSLPLGARRLAPTAARFWIWVSRSRSLALDRRAGSPRHLVGCPLFLYPCLHLSCGSLLVSWSCSNYLGKRAAGWRSRGHQAGTRYLGLGGALRRLGLTAWFVDPGVGRIYMHAFIASTICIYFVSLLTLSSASCSALLRTADRNVNEPSRHSSRHSDRNLHPPL